MRRFLIMFTVPSLLFALTVGVAPPGHAGERDIPSNGLRVGPGYWCDKPEYDLPCTTDLEVNATKVISVDETSASARLISLSNGQVIPLNDDYAWGTDSDKAIFETSSVLPTGRYELVVTFDTPGHWWCSKYNPDGCSWMESETDTLRWRFVHTAGGGSVFYREYLVPRTTVQKWRLGSPSATKRSVSGTVVSRIEQSDYTLTGWQVQKARKVRVQMKERGRWRTMKTVRTNASGKFKAIVRVKARSQHYWRVVIPAAGKSPGVTY